MSRIKIPRYWLYLVPVPVLFLLVWCGFLMVAQPYSGLEWSYYDGDIASVDENGPAAGELRPGERILAIDGKQVYTARNLPERRAGETVVFSIDAGAGQSPRQVPIVLVDPPASMLGRRLVILPVALAFWLLGAIVLAYGQSGRLVLVFFLTCQTIALILGLGAVSSYAPLWSAMAFSLLLWWIGPLMVHTHFALPSIETVRPHRVMVTVLYALAFVFSLLDANRMLAIDDAVLRSIKYLWMVLLILLAAGSLVYNSIWGAAPEDRRRTRIAGISALAALMPSIFFSLLPEALTGQYLLPYNLTLLALLLLPLGYSYSILTYKLLKVERVIHQGAAYALAAFVLFILYAFFYIYSTHFFPFRSRPSQLVEIAIAFALLITVQPAHRWLYRWFYQVFYGGWVDDHGAVKRISEDLKHVTGDPYSIAQTLVQTLQRTLLLEYVHLLISDGRLIKTTNDSQTTSERYLPGAQEAGAQEAGAQTAGALTASSLFLHLQEQTGRDLGSAEQLRGFLASAGLDAAGLLGPRAQLWMLVSGRRSWQGLLVLGSKRGRGDFETRDLEILEVVLRQAGAALENERLLEDVRQRSTQIRELNRKARWTLEVERKRIARDLHDVVIQTLIGVNFQLANVRARSEPHTAGDLEAIRGDLHDSLVALRSMCAELRPPALDALGLLPALEARITELKSQATFEIVLNTADFSAYEIHDEAALCIYRFVQEALLNVQKHSSATRAQVTLSLERADLLRCSVEDNGAGFQPPETLEVLVGQQHFGLIGLQEQVEAVGGHMQIESAPGQGCRLTAWVLLQQPTESAVPDSMIMTEEEDLQNENPNSGR